MFYYIDSVFLLMEWDEILLGICGYENIIEEELVYIGFIIICYVVFIVCRLCDWNKILLNIMI